MNRRAFLATGALTTASVLAGCSGSDDGVTLVSLDTVYEWHQNDEAQFIDTRGQLQYNANHIAGAHLSTAPNGVANDPTAEWDHGTKIVAYCDCPHSLALQRGETLIEDGFTDLNALEPGYPAWQEAGYPTESNVVADVAEYDIRGMADPADAGEYVWVSDPDGGQHEVSPVESDGSYQLTFRFADLEDESVLHVETPSYAGEATLEALTEDVVTERTLV
ncbi:rhodanese-like domain-containing protein [Natronobiforma cellulositropha]|uniref:rhodanese-like domain-containing protein n=1 Tax=Natronobiforma cellulositropha TaxID=1679076 RepID=UPI0021D5F683|nr:rhodanese-like domain-containing protein [Natronobiforma cellulositropha]